MRTLVTGHNGYIGTVLVPLLQRAGHDVVGLDSDLFRECSFGEPGDEPRVDTIRKDIRDISEEDVTGFDAVVHLAGISNDPNSELDPRLTYELNWNASVRLATLSKFAGVTRFIFSSSCSAYEAADDDLLNEDADLSSVNPYEDAKIMVERDVARLADFSFSPVFLRIGTVYGPSPRLRADLLLNNLVARAYLTGRVPVMGAGTAWHQVAHVEDISRAFMAVLEAPREKVHCQAFNVGRTSENYRIRELAEIVRETVPGCEVEFTDNGQPEARGCRANCEKLPRVVPAYMPVWTARSGARQLHEAYQRFGFQLSNLEGARYRRIDYLRQLSQTGRIDEVLRWRSSESILQLNDHSIDHASHYPGGGK
jgi:nucleoside-diphosphate-sugar epimerase